MNKIKKKIGFNSYLIFFTFICFYPSRHFSPLLSLYYPVATSIGTVQKNISFFFFISEIRITGGWLIIKWLMVFWKHNNFQLNLHSRRILLKQKDIETARKRHNIQPDIRWFLTHPRCQVKLSAMHRHLA